MPARVQTVFQILLAIIVVLLCSIFFAYVWPDSAYGLAAWVQAVGSIVAIVGAFAVANRQIREQNRQTTLRALEEDVRSATFGRAAAERTLSAVDHFMEGLKNFPGNMPYQHDTALLEAAKTLIEMALQRSLPPKQTLVLVAHHNELMNVIQGVNELVGKYNILGYKRFKDFTDLWLLNIRNGTMDAIVMDVEASAALTEFQNKK